MNKKLSNYIWGIFIILLGLVLLLKTLNFIDFEIFFDEHPTLPNYYLLNEEEDSLSNERVSTYLNVVLTLENWDKIK